MIRKVYEVDPFCYPACGGKMRIISFIEEPKTVDRIIRHLELTFEAERPISGSCSPAEAPDDSRGEWGVFLGTSVAVFC